jgi:hypothetical protein
MSDEERNVFFTFPQRRNVNRKNIQAVVEVAAELFLPDHLFQIAMGGGYNPNVNVLRPRTAQALEFPFLPRFCPDRYWSYPWQKRTMAKSG